MSERSAAAPLSTHARWGSMKEAPLARWMKVEWHAFIDCGNDPQILPGEYWEHRRRRAQAHHTGQLLARRWGSATRDTTEGRWTYGVCTSSSRCTTKRPVACARRGQCRHGPLSAFKFATATPHVCASIPIRHTLWLDKGAEKHSFARVRDASRRVLEARSGVRVIRARLAVHVEPRSFVVYLRVAVVR